MNRKDELHSLRNKTVVDRRALLANAEAEKRELTADEESAYQALDAEFNTASDELDKIQKKEKREAQLAAHDLEQEQLEHEATDKREHVMKGLHTNFDNTNERSSVESRLHGLRPEYRVGGSRSCIQNGARFSSEYEDAYRKHLVLPKGDLTVEERKALYTARALQLEDDVKGGYLAAPEQFYARLIQDKDDLVFVRKRATYIPLTGSGTAGFPVLNNRMADADWTAEVKTGTEDSTLDFAKREIVPHALAKRIKVSKHLLNTAALPVDQIVRQEMAYKFAISEEKGFMTGTGSLQPLGLFTADNSGISTGRDMSTSNTTTAIKADNLERNKYNVKAQYRAGASWIFHRDGIRNISLLKDGNGQYLWQPGLTVSEPDRLLGYPVFESEYAPNTFTSGLYVGLFGNLREYWIVESLTMTIQVLLELYAETNENGYIGRAQLDGMPVDENAFSRVTMG